MRKIKGTFICFWAITWQKLDGFYLFKDKFVKLSELYQMIPKFPTTDTQISSYPYLKPEIRIFRFQSGITREWDIWSGHIWYHSVELTELNIFILGYTKSIKFWPSYGQKTNKQSFNFPQNSYFSAKLNATSKKHAEYEKNKNSEKFAMFMKVAPILGKNIHICWKTTSMFLNEHR